MIPQPQTLQLQLPTAPAGTVEGEVGRCLDQLLEEFDEGGVPPPEMCLRLLNLKALLLSQTQLAIPQHQVDGPIYLLGFIEGVRFLYGLLLPHMTGDELAAYDWRQTAAEISTAAQLSTTDAARALHDILP